MGFGRDSRYNPYKSIGCKGLSVPYGLAKCRTGLEYNSCKFIGYKGLSVSQAFAQFGLVTVIIVVMWAI